MTAQWMPGDPEPRNDEVRQVRGASGQIWRRSEPAGLFWWPHGGGVIASWREVLELDAPVVADRTCFTLTLFDVEVPA